MVSSADKDAAVSAAASSGVGSLSKNQLHAFNEAKRDKTGTGNQANNIAEGKPANESRRNFFGF